MGFAVDNGRCFTCANMKNITHKRYFFNDTDTIQNLEWSIFFGEQNNVFDQQVGSAGL
jgi:hypothetical protein